MKQIIKDISIAIAIVLIIIFGKISFVVNDEGTHTGHVTAIEKYGVFIKRYRVYFKTDNSSSQEDEYCVPANRKHFVEELRETQLLNKKVVVKYAERITLGLFNSNCGVYDEIYMFDVVN